MGKNNGEFLDNLKELVSGGYIMLFIFGATLCFMATSSLLAIIFIKGAPNSQGLDPIFSAKMGLFKEIIVGLMGFLAGAYTTMWNNQHFKTEQKKENGTNGKASTSITDDLGPSAAAASASTGAAGAG